MILHHYTALEYLPKIMAEGLTRGEVPMTRTFCLNAVWFTTQTSPLGHELTDGRPLTLQEKALLGLPPDSPHRFPNKRAVRITVDLPPDAVTEWIPWARGRIDREWLRVVNKSGGGMVKARSWYMSFNPISPDLFLSVDMLTESSAGRVVH
ncbi:hypothetical protein M3484_22460 [Pseudomonas sp. GX19020]|uniref:hypothetical protein n=1 Tax=Pseudomonas sp. GX19020 TaxID=2942277 RepID=UPI002018D936|nr:hypothetical protein [Pseudomonas sp. GX19020]MCL4069325.1 hypothetical protein [Pseudomonas sp. GX19020]